MKKRSFLREILFYVVLLVGIVVILSTMFSNTGEEPLTYGQVLEMIHNKQVKEIEVNKNNDTVTMLADVNGDGKYEVVSYEVGDLSVFYNDLGDDLAKQKLSGTLESYDIIPIKTYPWWVSMLPWLLIFVVIIIIYVISFRQISGKGGGKFNSFGKAKVRVPNQNDANRVLFRDVAGADEEKEELVEIVEFLKNPSKFTSLGAKIPHGVLLVGPPGTGKTLLAKAVAGEAGVPFFSISGSDFVEMYVGVGASRVRDLFDTARKSPASIIFIDEIDAVGRHRGAGLGGGHDEREQTLNQLLVEMDGFGSHDGIIVMAATNRPDILDPALLRPGRFDRQVTVNYPDMKGREEILKVHARNKPLEESVDFHKVAQSTVGFTGADLANLLNEAALLAAKKSKALIGMDDIEESFMKSLLGPQKKSKVRTEKENKLTAYHEAGHAVVSYYCENTDPVKHITIIPAGRAGGVTVSVPEEDVSYSTKGDMIDNIRMSLGGRIAEELIMDDISTGASGDIQQATNVARKMVTRYGMCDKLRTALYGSEHSSDEVFLGRDFSSGKNYSEQTAAAIDAEIQRIIGDCYADAKKILCEHIDKLHFVAQYLIKHESMDGDQFAAAMKDGATDADLEAIAEEKAEKSRRDNEERMARQRAEEEAKAKAEADAQGKADDENDTQEPQASNVGQTPEPTPTEESTEAEPSESERTESKSVLDDDDREWSDDWDKK